MAKRGGGSFHGAIYKLGTTFGLGQPTGIELPAEGLAQLKSRSQFVNSPVEAATTSFGQSTMQLGQLNGIEGKAL
ncbi:MAG: hypothetical protein AAFY17_11035, partial [Cyanobacteria bacterium J06642_11]